MKKRILIISPFFAPEQNIASIRFTKVAKYLIKEGYDVSVIRTDMSMGAFRRDAILEKDLENIPQVYTVNYRKLRSTLGGGLQGGAAPKTAEKKVSAKKKIFAMVTNKKLMASIEKKLVFSLFEKKLAKDIAKKAEELVKKNGVFDAAIATYCPIASIVAGVMVKKRGLAKKLILDYRDTIETLEKHPSSVKSQLKFSADANAEYADAISAVGDGVREHIIETTLQYSGVDVSDKFHVITNGFDPEEIENTVFDGWEKTSEKLTFIFAGSIYDNVYGGNSPAPLFNALQELTDEGKILADKIEIRYAGNCGAAFKSIAERSGWKHPIKDYGMLPRDKVLSLYNNTDVFLVLAWCTKEDSGMLTGKLFEAINLKRYIMAIVTGTYTQSELAAVVDRYSLGCSYVQGDASRELQALKENILKIYYEKLESGTLSFKGNGQEVFSHTNLVKKFKRIIEG